MKKVCILSLILLLTIVFFTGCAAAPGTIAEAEISDYVRQNLSEEFIPTDELDEYVNGDTADYVHIDDIADYVRQNMGAEFIPADEIDRYIGDTGRYIRTDEIENYVRKNMTNKFIPADEVEAYTAQSGNVKSENAEAAEQTETAAPSATPEYTKTPPAEEAEGGGGSGTYVGSKNSDKFHDPSCQWAKKIKPSNEVWFASREAAQSAGYVACKVCKP